MHRGQKILLSPTSSQVRYFVGACGLARFSWNWALSLCQRYYRIFGRRPGFKRPNWMVLRSRWNKIKSRRFAWVSGFSKHIAEESFRELDQAYKKAFARLKAGATPGFPSFRKKSSFRSFQVVPSSHFPIRRVGRRLRVPCLGLVRCQTKIRWPDAKQVHGRVKWKAGRWWLVIAYELPEPTPEPHTGPVCGIDLGCTTFATVASGGVIVEELATRKPYAKAKRKLMKLLRWKDRKKKGSNNRKKAVVRLARQHERVANVRADIIHQFTSRLVKVFGRIVIEDLNVRGMAKGRLAETIYDLGFGEFRRQVTYKAKVTGTKLVLAGRFYPSSKTCSHCGLVKTKLERSERTWTCESCGVAHNRDHNAALNLEKLGRDTPEVTPAEIGGSSTGGNTPRGAGRGSRNTNTKPIAVSG